ncbi:phage tail assembly chaperone [Microvirga makkahensis]|uniref:Phage tail assembly chaperone n=2 Tax=Microvirga makkahensis TaxID=1128670 RepID=A0A7X3MV74_9HYPH|nr:phage tail assembly chaperone [Microvirga makkahensis]
MMLGLSVLRWSPDQFWRATPGELFAAWEGLSGGRRVEPAVSRDLRRMMDAFPDVDGE